MSLVETIDAFLPQGYATAHKPSNQIKSASGAVDHLYKTVSNAFEISTAMAVIQLKSFRWLKLETTLAKKKEWPR